MLRCVSPVGATKQQALRAPDARGLAEVRVMRVDTVASPYNGRTLGVKTDGGEGGG